MDQIDQHMTHSSTNQTNKPLSNLTWSAFLFYFHIYLKNIIFCFFQKASATDIAVSKSDAKVISDGFRDVLYFGYDGQHFSF